MTEWDFRPPVHNGPTAPKRLRRTTQGMERVKRKAVSKYVKITRSERRREKKKVREKKEAAHLSVRLYFLLSLLVSCCLAG